MSYRLYAIDDNYFQQISLKKNLNNIWLSINTGLLKKNNISVVLQHSFFLAEFIFQKKKSKEIKLHLNFFS